MKKNSCHRLHRLPEVCTDQHGIGRTVALGRASGCPAPTEASDLDENLSAYNHLDWHINYSSTVIFYHPYTHIYICVYICIYIFVHIYIYLYIFIYTYIDIYIYIIYNVYDLYVQCMDGLVCEIICMKLLILLMNKHWISRTSLNQNQSWIEQPWYGWMLLGINAGNKKTLPLVI